ncbi:tripartite tricarboxylate transporter substrate binding protein [Comamonas sp. lk]|uniref:Bug family tripartite tricarboxylate transporter substrate binding protein n=1 Tax=Comamonas sp. lk TaxID=2201272 RepID=UPI000EB57524|nr:tripartite tricarboxylate transporter substrate binding protein [Comamonas sp. lk]
MTIQLQRRAVLAAIALVATTAGTSFPTIAADFPDRPLRLVVPYPAGGGADTLGRVLAKQLSESLKQAVVVENVIGAAGTMAASSVARARGDGYTLMLSNTATHAIAPALYPQLPYDPVKDFVPLVHIASFGNAIAVHPSLPVHNVKELIAWSKKTSNGGSYGSWGIGSAGHLAMEMLQGESGTKMLHIPYKGALLALNDTIAGQLPLTMVDVTTITPFYKTGKVRVIAVTGSKRAPSMPDVPTLTEQGITFDTDSWYAVFAPPQTPRPVQEKLRAALAKLVVDQEIQKTLASLGLNPSTLNVDEFAVMQRKDVATWARLAKLSGAKLE